MVAEVFPNLLSQPYGSEYLYGNTVNAVAHLLHGTARRAASSEYYRARGPRAVADVFPNLLSQPYGSEYLHGNTINAVAHLLHGTRWRATSSEYFRARGPTVVASVPRRAAEPAEFVEFANYRR